MKHTHTHTHTSNTSGYYGQLVCWRESSGQLSLERERERGRARAGLHTLIDGEEQKRETSGDQESLCRENKETTKDKRGNKASQLMRVEDVSGTSVRLMFSRELHDQRKPSPR